MKKTYILFLLALLPLAHLHAQNNVGQLIRSGVENTKILLRAYGGPIAKSFGTDLNSGWVTSAQPFEPGRFEVRVFANATFIPERGRTFDVNALGLSSQVRLAPGQSSQAPTFFGENRPGPLLDVYGRRSDTGEEVKLVSFNLPEGSGYHVAPIPMAQLNVGLVKETELLVRFLPEINFDDNQVKLWGLGLKHNLGQWIPALTEKQVQLTSTVAYTSFRSAAGLQVLPEAGVSNPDPGDYSGQRVVYNTNAVYASLVVGKSFWKRSNVYAGLSYSRSNTDTALEGTYPITILRNQAPYNKEIFNVTYPVQLEFQDDQVGLTTGLRLKLSVLSLNLEGTLARYPSASAGIGLGWN